MATQLLVSIITPTYNHDRFIAQCIESVLAQTYPYWEQIIVDDGSTDGTAEIASRYRDERIKYVRQNNVGPWRLSETYNKALRMSRGQLVAVLEGDDFWPPDKLEKQVPAFERPEVVLSWGRAAMTNSHGQIFAMYPDDGRWRKWLSNRSKEGTLRGLLFENVIPGSAAMCRRDALLSIGGFKQPDYIPAVDTSTWLELSLVGEFAAVDAVMGYWRRHPDQLTSLHVLENSECGKYSLDFFERLAPEVRDSLGITATDLAKRRRDILASAHFAVGRGALFRREWKEAREHFRQALSGHNLPRTSKALLGIACSYLRIDLEWAARLTGVPSMDNFL